MDVLHILRSRSAAETRALIAALSKGHRCTEIEFHDQVIDYDELVKLIFDADRVISWW